MIWKGKIQLIVFLVSSFLLVGTLFANQLKNQDSCETTDKKNIHCNSFESKHDNSFPTPIISNSLVSNEDISIYPDGLDFFSFDSIFQTLTEDTSDREQPWSVLSALLEEDSQNEIQKEIELTEVEDEIDEDQSQQSEVAGQPQNNQQLCVSGQSDNVIQENANSNCQDIQKKNLLDAESSYPVPDIPVYKNKRIEAFIKLYTKKKRKVFVKAIERLPKYQGMITETFREYELPLNLTYLAVVESNLNPNARSRANAVGLWQFMSYTGKHFGLSRSWWHDDRYDPEKSTFAAAKYLKQLHKQFKGDWELALAAYNSGSGTVRRAIKKAKKKGKSTDYWSLQLPRETRGYVPAFYAVSIIFADLEKYGFKEVQPQVEVSPKQYLDVGGGIALNQLAKLFKVELEMLSELNPRLRFRGLTPPTLKSFDVAIPASVTVDNNHLKRLQTIKQNRHEKWKVHRVKQGETLWSISRFYRIPLNKILAYNRLKRRNILRIGQKLMLPVPVDWNPPKVPSKTKLAVRDIDKLPGVTKIHVVQKGETLWRISQMYDIPIRKIKYWNRRVLGRKYLKIGTEIVLKLPLSVASSSI